MERRIANIIICGLVALMTAGTSLYQTAGAQEYVAPPVTISKDKVKIDGKVFYSHIVLEKQTLFSISKAYNVSIEDIYKYNPSVKETGLRKNDIINIPMVEAVPQKAEEPQAEEVISYEEEPVRTISGEIRHTVKWYEDLPSIAARYKVSEESIVRANALPSHKVKNRQVLIIPKEELQREAPVYADISVAEASFEEEPATEEESTDLDQYSDTLFVMDYWDTFQKHTVNLSLILPLKATGTSSNRNNMDFYSGILLAAREFKEKGTEVHLNVYDIAAGHSSIPTDDLKSSDIIIGPVAPADIEQIAIRINGACPIVSPLDQKAEKLTSKYRNIIQAPASQHAQFSDIANWLQSSSTHGADDKVIVISEKEARQNDAGRVLRSIIDRSDIHYTPFSYSILEGRNIQSSLEAAMSKTGTNRVVIASESEAFVNDAVRNLNLIVHNKFKVELYAPAKIRTFETIEVENFHNTSLHASLSYFIDYENDMVKGFIMKYRAMFGTEPTQFAFQGYDLANYFIRLISEYPTNWMSYITTEEGEKEELQSYFKFQQNGNGGYINNGVKRIRYWEDYSIVRLYYHD